MDLRANAIGLVSLTVAAIAIVGLISTASVPAYERRNCKSHEVYRQSDTACYVPQGE